jgi:hypothetical protein
MEIDLQSSLVQLALQMDEHMLNIKEIITLQNTNQTLEPSFSPAQSQKIQEVIRFYSNPELHPKQIWYHSLKLVKQLSIPTQQQLHLQSNNIYSLLADSNDNLSIGSMNESLSQPDLKSSDHHVKM